MFAAFLAICFFSSIGWFFLLRFFSYRKSNLLGFFYSFPSLHTIQFQKIDANTQQRQAWMCGVWFRTIRCVLMSWCDFTLTSMLHLMNKNVVFVCAIMCSQRENGKKLLKKPLFVLCSMCRLFFRVCVLRIHCSAMLANFLAQLRTTRTIRISSLCRCVRLFSGNFYAISIMSLFDSLNLFTRLFSDSFFCCSFHWRRCRHRLGCFVMNVA